MLSGLSQFLSFEWEKEVVERFYNLVENTKDMEWSLSNQVQRKIYIFFLVEIRSTYLTQHRLIIGSHEEDIFKSLWKINLPKKVAFFVESVFGQTSNETKSQEKTGYAGKWWYTLPVLSRFGRIIVSFVIHVWGGTTHLEMLWFLRQRC